MDAVQLALRAVLQRTLDQRSQAEVEVQRSIRSLRIRLDAAEAPGWPGEWVALMQPAPPKSRDERWFAALEAAAKGPRRLAVPAPAANGPAFGYPQVREYAQALVAALAAQHPAAAQVAMPLPGLAHGLDEGACLEHLLLGLVDALAAQASAGAWQELVLLEPNDGRRRLLAEKLDALLAATTPPDAALHPGAWSLVYFPAADGAARPPAPFETHLTYQDTLTAFVAMPFRADMRDIFQYGIQAPALRARFKAERLDFEHFTGSIVEQIKERIQRAHLVIADMTGANANVFLEIGYAWGKGRPTVLLWRKPPEGSPPQGPPFDVTGDSRIDYEHIGDLDQSLGEKLRALYPVLRQRAFGPD